MDFWLHNKIEQLTRDKMKGTPHQPESCEVTEEVVCTVLLLSLQNTKAGTWFGASITVANKIPREEKLKYSYYIWQYKLDYKGIKRFTCTFTSLKDNNEGGLILWALILFKSWEDSCKGVTLQKNEAGITENNITLKVKQHLAVRITSSVI